LSGVQAPNQICQIMTNVLGKMISVLFYKQDVDTCAKGCVSILYNIISYRIRSILFFTYFYIKIIILLIL